MRVNVLGQSGVNTTLHCQNEIDQDINTQSDQFLQLKQVLQNIKGKDIATLLAKLKGTTDVVLKVQFTAAANKEYQTQEQLSVSGCEGFIKYTCLFSCQGSKEYIQQFGTRLTKPSQLLCKAKGNDISIIMMPYVKKESLEFALKELQVDQVSTILQLVVKNVFCAYTNLKFVHLDLFCKNILLTDANDPVIIDFEMSTFQGSAEVFWRDIDGLLVDVGRHKPTMSRSLDVVISSVLMLRAYNRPPSSETVQEVLHAIALIT